MAESRQYTQEEIREGAQFKPMELSIWREALVALDWVSLRASPVYRGIDITSGDGSAVVLVPAFLMSDRYLSEIQGWLRRIGYQPYLSGIGRNMNCPNVLTQRLRSTIERAGDETNGKVHLIGHSLGGVIARSAAVQWPQRVASVITLASPFLGVHAHPLILRAQSMVRGVIRARGAGDTAGQCYTGECGCDFVNALKRPFTDRVPQTAIYTKADGVVDWRRCMNGNPDNDIEVTGTHIGMVFNPDVYRHIAERLARTRERNASSPEALRLT